VGKYSQRLSYISVTPHSTVFRQEFPFGPGASGAIGLDQKNVAVGEIGMIKGLRETGAWGWKHAEVGIHDPKDWSEGFKSSFHGGPGTGAIDGIWRGGMGNSFRGYLPGRRFLDHFSEKADGQPVRFRKMDSWLWFDIAYFWKDKRKFAKIWELTIPSPRDKKV
jgi:hypothetical protein